MNAVSPFRGSAVLPSHSRLLQQILADLAADRLATVDVAVIRSIVDPWTCPMPLLPWLAWAMSVDVWDDAWPENTKRRVIAASPEVHRIKGTRRAVRLALEALGARTTIREWWESMPPARRGTFRVQVHADGSGPILDLKLLGQLREAIKRSKPKSRVFELEIALQAEAPIWIAATVRSIVRTTLLPYQPPAPVPVAPLYVAGVYGSAPSRRVVLFPGLPGNVPALTPVQVGIGLASGVRRMMLLPSPTN